jgi:hypothetical protein
MTNRVWISVGFLRNQPLWAAVLLASSLFAPWEAAAQSRPLFNGVDLQGWKIHGTELWYVEDGELICESGPDGEYGYLATEQTFGDFELTLEFKQEADGNSGVFFRSSLDGTRISGWQAEVAPPGLWTGGLSRADLGEGNGEEDAQDRLEWPRNL